MHYMLDTILNGKAYKFYGILTEYRDNVITCPLCKEKFFFDGPRENACTIKEAKPRNGEIDEDSIEFFNVVKKIRADIVKGLIDQIKIDGRCVHCK